MKSDSKAGEAGKGNPAGAAMELLFPGWAWSRRSSWSGMKEAREILLGPLETGIATTPTRSSTRRTGSS